MILNYVNSENHNGSFDVHHGEASASHAKKLKNTAKKRRGQGYSCFKGHFNLIQMT